MQGHIIVCGDDPLGLRIIEQLRAAGREIAIVFSSAELRDAGIADAAALICADDDDALNLEIALLARQLNPTMRVVARLGNSVLREAVAIGNGPGAILDVADLAAPSVVEACLSRTTHSITAAGIEFVVSGTDAPRDATLREIFGDLAPVAVVRGENSADSRRGGGLPRPRRARRRRRLDGDDRHRRGTGRAGHRGRAALDRADRGRPPGARGYNSQRRKPLKRVLDAVRAFRDDVNPNFFKAFAASMTLLLSATVLLRFTYHKPGMSFIDALYFSTETIATVGYGDFSFVDQPTWLRLFGIGLMFAGVTSTAVLMAFVADLLLSRRIAQNAGLRKVRELNDHIIVVGPRLVRHPRGRRPQGRGPRRRGHRAQPRQPLPVVGGRTRRSGDLRRRDAARDARLGADRRRGRRRGADPIATWSTSRRASCCANGWACGGCGRPTTPGVPVVLRVYDRTLGAAVAHRFGFENVRSTVELAAPWFIGTAMGLQVLGTFSVGQQSFMVGGVEVEPGSELDGLRMEDMSTARPASSRSSAPPATSSCIPGETVSCPRATRPTSSGRTASCSTRCTRASASRPRFERLVHRNPWCARVSVHELARATPACEPGSGRRPSGPPRSECAADEVQPPDPGDLLAVQRDEVVVAVLEGRQPVVDGADVVLAHRLDVADLEAGRLEMADRLRQRAHVHVRRDVGLDEAPAAGRGVRRVATSAAAAADRRA